MIYKINESKKVKRSKQYNKIMYIIREFKKFDKPYGGGKTVLEKTFTEGFCYDFAYMLWTNVPGSRIFYNVKEHHYILENDGDYFDITGHLTLDDDVKLEEDDVGISK